MTETHRRRDELLEDRLADWLATQTAPFSLAEAAVGCGLVSTETEAPRITHA